MLEELKQTKPNLAVRKYRF
jgi:hypothetical protein